MAARRWSFWKLYRQRESEKRRQAEQMFPEYTPKDFTEFDFQFHAKALETLNQCPQWRPKM